LRGVPIKIFYGIGACRGTIPATDASMIDLYHESLFIFVGGVDRAHLGARGVIAMHAWSGKQSRLDTRIFPLDIRNQLHPINGAPLCGLFGSNDPQIVFCMASHDTGLTSRTFI